jgi:hypothetical protein
MKHFSVLLVALALTGCSASYQQQVLKETTAKLERGKGVFIAIPKDGWYGKIEYKSSGRMTANALRAAFSRFSNIIQVAEDCFALDCLKKAFGGSFVYLVVPDILHWEDRATEWSGIPDRIEVKISVYDAVSGAELTSVIVSGKSKWGTFGGDHPQDLLPEPINKFVESLY